MILNLCRDLLTHAKDIEDIKFVNKVIDELPPWNNMLYSFKPIKMKYWIKKEYAEKLVS